jgi:hypothetical protein
MPLAAKDIDRYRDLAAALLSASDAPDSLELLDIPSFLAVADHDGLLGLLYDAVSAAAAADRLPRGLLDGLRAGAHRQAARELVQRVELQRVLAAMRWSARFTLLKEHLLPDAAYMRRTYANGSSAPIGWLYLRRIATGASKWF